MTTKYLLDGDTPVVCDDLLEWAAGFEKTDVHVADETISGITISTVFLGIDHNFLPTGSPLLFETMIFGGGTRSGTMAVHYQRGSVEGSF